MGWMVVTVLAAVVSGGPSRVRRQACDVNDDYRNVDSGDCLALSECEVSKTGREFIATRAVYDADQGVSCCSAQDCTLNNVQHHAYVIELYSSPYLFLSFSHFINNADLKLSI